MVDQQITIRKEHKLTVDVISRFPFGMRLQLSIHRGIDHVYLVRCFFRVASNMNRKQKLSRVETLEIHDTTSATTFYMSPSLFLLLG